VARRYVDYQPAQLTAGDAFELGADRLDVKAGNEWRSRFDDRPGLLDELVQ